MNDDFVTLYLQKAPIRILELLAAHDDKELRRLRSRTFEAALIRAARAVPIPEGPWMPYRVIFKRDFFSNAEQCMVARAVLIARHCKQEGVKAMLKIYRENDWETRIEVWVRSVPIGCRMLEYRRGLYRQQIQIFCEELKVPYFIVVPFCDRLDLCERYNPANTFSLTPDCEDVFNKMVRLAN